MDQCTENYECLVINNNAKSNELEDQVFWYKAAPRDSFRIGANKFWEYSQKNYSSHGGGGGAANDFSSARRDNYVVNKKW